MIDPQDTIRKNGPSGEGIEVYVSKCWDEQRVSKGLLYRSQRGCNTGLRCHEMKGEYRSVHLFQ